MTHLPEMEIAPDADPMETTHGVQIGRWARSRNLWVGLGLGFAIALIGTRLVGTDSASPEASPAAPAQGTTQAVTVAAVTVGPIAETLTVTGSVQPADLLTVTPQIGGLQIRQVLVAVGDQVGAGQPLVILDDSDLVTQIQQAEAQIDVARAQVQQQRASLAQAEASRTEANTNLQRYQSLQAQGAISAEELDSRATQAVTAQESVRVAQASVVSAEATVRSREADVTRLRTQLDYTVVRAPTAGVVAEPPATVGDVSSTGSAVVSLIRDNQLELAAEVPQAQLDRVAVGAPAIVTSSTDLQVRATGAVQEIRPLVDATTRTAQVIIRFPASNRLRSGMFLTAEIQVGSRTGLTVPAAALLPQADGSLRVFVVGSENQTIARTVETGTRLSSPDGEAAPVEIRSGLQAGERVVVAGAGYIQEGDRVNIAEDF